MNPDTIEFIAKMFQSDISIALKDAEAIARIKEDFRKWAESQKPEKAANHTDSV